MSEPIQELIDRWRDAILWGEDDTPIRAAIEREVAALREQILNALAAETQYMQRIADLEAERAALMEAGKVLANPLYRSRDELWAARDVLAGKPGALAAWMAKEGR